MPPLPPRLLPDRGLALAIGFAVALLCSGCVRFEAGAGGQAALTSGARSDCSWWTGPTCKVVNPFEPVILAATPDTGWELAGFYDSDGTERCPGQTSCRIVSTWPSPHITAVFLPQFFEATPLLGDDGIVYLHDPARSKIHRWDSQTEHYLTPIAIGAQSRDVAYAHQSQQIYVLYRDAIRRIDLRRGFAERPFLDAYQVTAIQMIGDALLVESSYETQLIRADGSLAATPPYSDALPGSAWDPNRQSLFSIHRSSAGLGRRSLPLPNGPFGTSTWSNEYDVRPLLPPLEVSRDGTRVASRAGDIFDATTLIRTDSIEAAAAVVWLADGGIATLRERNGASLLERNSGRLRPYEARSLPGAPRHLLANDEVVIAITQRSGRPAFHLLPLRDDVDGDGIGNATDAFPDDPAAALDLDDDRAPDAWNDGKGPTDSTTGLTVLDAFPGDPACQLPEHVRPGTAECDLGTAVPLYEPNPQDIAMDRNGVVLLLSREQRKIFRWSSHDATHLRPLPIGPGVRAFAYGATLHRIYLAYVDGRITRIELGSSHVEVPHAERQGPILGLLEAGTLLFVDHSGGQRISALRSGGAFAAERKHAGGGTGHVWSAGLQRAFWSEIGGTSLHWQRIENPGRFTGSAVVNTQPFPATPPIRIEPGDRRLLTGSGDFYDVNDLRRVASLPIDPVDATWGSDGDLVTLRGDTSGATTRIEHWSTDLLADASASVAGAPLRIFPDGGTFLVVTQHGGRPHFQRHARNDDRDADGVVDAIDDFPEDPAAAFDGDGDGAPDAWNDGKGPSDSTTGLVDLDAFPNDSACQTSDHAIPGEPDRCDIAARIPAYVPDPEQMLVDRDGIAHLLSIDHRRVYRWSLPDGAHRNPIVIGAGASAIAYTAANHRLYVGYEAGTITKVELAHAEREAIFAAMPDNLVALVGAGVNLVATIGQPVQGWLEHVSIRPDGVAADREIRFGSTLAYEWNAASDRLFFSTYFDEIVWLQVDPVSAAITPRSDAGGYYRSLYALPAPLRVSPDASSLLTGSGRFFDVDDLEWRSALPIDPEDAVWRDTTQILTIRATDADTTRAEQWSAAGWMSRWQELPGLPLRVFEHGGAGWIVTLHDGRPSFAPFQPGDDADGDGAGNDADAFPTDPAASRDADGDGVPDAWNPGRSEADSTTGLVSLDAFPQDASCQSSDHARSDDPARCDFTRGVWTSAFQPRDVVVDRDGVAYLLAGADRRVLRWSISGGERLDSLVVGAGAQRIEYRPGRHELVIGYANGEIRRIVLGADRRERRLTTLAQGVETLAAMGDFTYTDDGIGAQILDRNANRSAQQIDPLHETTAGWDADRERLFLFGRYSPYLRWHDFDATTGTLGERQESWSTGYPMPPIRFAPDGERLLIGTGEIFHATTLAPLAKLRVAPVDATFLPDGGLVTLRALDGATRLERWTPALQIYDSATLPGTPVRVVTDGVRVVAITRVAGQPAFHPYAITDDADGDGAVNELDAWPHDPAASLDRDADGAPDAWNPGKGPADSTSGLLAIDAFPDDSACQRPEQALPADPDRCDVAGSLAPYVAQRDDIFADANGIVYLLVREQRRIHRWSPRTGPLNPIPIQPGAHAIAYAPGLDRIYVAYASGEIRRIEIAAPHTDLAFAWIDFAPEAMVAARDLLLLRAGQQSRSLRSDGGVALSVDYGYIQWQSPVWSPAQQRLFLLDEDFDLVLLRGSVAADTGSVEHEDGIRVDRPSAPLRLDPDGARLATGRGEIYSTLPLARLGALPTAIHDAAWLPDGTLVTARHDASAGGTRVEAWNDALEALDAIVYPGQPVRLVGDADGAIVVTRDGERMRFQRYAQAGDADADAVGNADDAYPLDPAASLDTDRDGAPDAWNPGRSAADSTSGLTGLDAFPFDSACQWPEQAFATDASRCDIAGALPAYTPDAGASFVDRDGILYLPSFALGRIFRWSIATGEDLNPLVIDSDVAHVAYAPQLHRLHLANGVRIDTIDLDGTLVPEPWATIDSNVGVLVAAGPFVVAYTQYGRLVSIDAGGQGVWADQDWSGYDTRELAWSESRGALFLRDGAQRLVTRDFNGTTGSIGTRANGPSIPDLTAPLRPSPDGQRVLVGSGALYDATSFGQITRLGSAITDALWFADGSLATLRGVSPDTSQLEYRDAALRPVAQLPFPGAPIGVFVHAEVIAVVTLEQGRPRFQRLVATELR